MLALISGSADYERQSLDQWIDEVVRDDTRGGPCTAISLMHMVGPGDGREVWTAPVNGKKPAELAEMFERKARSTAQDLGTAGSGVQMFELWVFYANRAKPEAWKPLPVKSKVPRDGFGSEGPAGHGPEAQRMRHLEGSQQQVFAKQAHLDRTQADLITFLGSTAVGLMRENAQMAKDMISAFAREADKSHQHRMAEIAAMKSTMREEKLWALAPAAVNTAFGKEVFPQQKADGDLLKLIVETTADDNPEFLEMIVGAFKDKPEVGGILAARVAEIVKAKTDKEDEREKALSGIPEGDPEADAGGQVIKLVAKEVKSK